MTHDALAQAIHVVIHACGLPFVPEQESGKVVFVLAQVAGAVVVCSGQLHADGVEAV